MNPDHYLPKLHKVNLVDDNSKEKHIVYTDINPLLVLSRWMGRKQGVGVGEFSKNVKTLYPDEIILLENQYDKFRKKLVNL